MTRSAVLPRSARWAAAIAIGLLLVGGAVDRRVRDWRGIQSTAVTPLALPLTELPPAIGPYLFDRDVPIDPIMIDVAAVDSFINRSYVNRAAGKNVTLYVGYWGRVNVGMGHGPDVCYVAIGWQPEPPDQERTLSFATADGPSTATLALYRFSRIRPGGVDRLAVAFTTVVDGRFQAASRGEFWHRPPRLRGDEAPPFLAQIQVVSQVAGDAWEPVEADLVDFVQQLLPNLVRCFPQRQSPGSTTPH